MEGEKKLLNQKRKPTPIEDSEEEMNSELFKKTIKNKRPNRKRLLKNKLEFFLSDINLCHDNYLRKKYMSNNYGVNPEIFLGFKSIIILLSDINSTEHRKEAIIKSVEISNKIYYDKNTNLIKRKYDFHMKEVNNELMDSLTVFVRNLPPYTTISNIFEMFNNNKIEYVSLLKKKTKNLDDKNEASDSKKSNYTNAFITLKDFEESVKFIKDWNNTVPNIPVSLLKKSRKSNLMPLVVITKKEWLENKKNNLKKEGVSNITLKNNVNLEDNFLIKVNGLIPQIKLVDFKKALSKYCVVLFVDLDRENSSCIIRLLNEKEYNKLVDIFKKINKTDFSEIKAFLNTKQNRTKIKYNLIEGEEKNEYINKVRKFIDDFHQKKLIKKTSELNINDDTTDKEKSKENDTEKDSSLNNINTKTNVSS